MISVDYTSKNILDEPDMDEVVYWYCEKAYKQGEYSSPDEMMQSVIAIEYFPNGTFKDLLTQYYEEKGQHIEDKVRSYVEYKNGFLMEHGCGYSWENEDLYDRNKKGFLEWLENKGFTLVDG